MPVAEVRAVLEAPDDEVRDEVIAAHLRRLEAQVERTREAIASLRGLLGAGRARPIAFRSVPAVRTAAISAVVGLGEVVEWWRDAVAEISATLSAAGVAPAGVVGGLYSMALFSEEVGEATVFVPVAGDVPAAGRVRVVEVPAADVAVVVHSGTEHGEDEAYGELGTFVAERGIGVAGPVREYYLDGAIEICWPVSSIASV